MKKVPTIVAAVLAGVVICFLLNNGLPAVRAQSTAPTTDPSLSSYAQPACDAKRTVQSSGTAVINVPPDRALIELGVQSNGATPDAVEAANSTTMARVVGAVRALGVDARDIATDWYIIDPVYDDYTSLYIKGYRINNTVAITLRDVTLTSKVIGEALKAGANQVINVDLYTSELRKWRDQARDMAVKAAAEKAQALASAAGASTGCVMNITENTSSNYNGWWWSGRSSNQWTQNSIQNVVPAGGSANEQDPDTISLGQISVRAEVQATFSLK